MGLDIFFEKTTRKRHSKQDSEKEEVAYFRKVNFLIPFFNYEDDCSYLEITKEEIENLIVTCEKVLENHDLAEELLPTTSGFFFGSTDYDEDYFEDVEYVKTTFENILSNLEKDDIILMCCWW